MKGTWITACLILCLLSLAGAVAAPRAGATPPRSITAPYQGSTDEPGDCESAQRTAVGFDLTLLEVAVTDVS